LKRRNTGGRVVMAGCVAKKGCSTHGRVVSGAVSGSYICMQGI
jgi:hypothetical protein